MKIIGLIYGILALIVIGIILIGSTGGDDNER